MPHLYYLSDCAYTELLKLAKESGFVSYNAKRNEGMGKFLHQLSFVEFEDTRPSDIIEKHRQVLAKHSHPKWALKGEGGGIKNRRARFLELSEEAVNNYIRIAITLQVYITRKLVNGGQVLATDNSVASRVLEAIGIGWVTPKSLPVNMTGNKRELRGRESSIRRVQRVAQRERTVRSSPTLQEKNAYDEFIRRSNARAKRTSKTT